jgi:hypothetical protein
MNDFRPLARPLPDGFPKLNAYLFTLPENFDSLQLTLASWRATDWGSDPALFIQPSGRIKGRDSAAETYRNVLERAAADRCDFALIAEDDVRFVRKLRHNLFNNPLIVRDQCDYLGLFIPDLIRDPWQRRETALGYRLAKPRYRSSPKGWAKNRIWGSQAYVLSARLIAACLERWDRLTGGQDSRVLAVCGELRLPLWYTEPCLVEHAPLRTAFETPTAYAPDFDAEFALPQRSGFEPPEAVQEPLEAAECRLLYDLVDGRRVFVFGQSIKAVISVAQSANSVAVTMDMQIAEAAAWLQRYGLRERIVQIQPGDPGATWEVTVVDAYSGASEFAHNLSRAAGATSVGGTLAVCGYPDPDCANVRRAVQTELLTKGWRRVRQSGYVALFQTTDLPQGQLD